MKIALLKQNVVRLGAAAVMAISMSSVSAYAVESIDDVTHYVHQVLKTRGPNEQYKQQLLENYDTQLRELGSFIEDFLDKSLDGSTQAFIERLDQDMTNYYASVVQKMSNDAAAYNDAKLLGAYHKVNHLYNEFVRLAGVIKSNKDQKQPWVVAPLLLPYKHLIPKKLQAKYDKPTIIMDALKHRLRCKGKRARKLDMAITAAYAQTLASVAIDDQGPAPMDLD